MEPLDILKPEIYALPVQSNGEKGWALAIAQDFEEQAKRMKRLRAVN